MGENSDVAKGCLFPAAIAAGVAGLWWLALVPLRIWHKAGTDGQQHPVTATYIAYAVSALLVVTPLMFFSIRSANRRAVTARRAVPASGPPMTSMPPTASESRAWAEAGGFALYAPPLCLHLGAVKVPDLYGKVLHCWCPDCDPDCRKPLPPSWRLLCCGSEPEAPHAYNCPQRLKEVTP